MTLQFFLITLGLLGMFLSALMYKRGDKKLGTKALLASMMFLIAGAIMIFDFSLRY